MKRLLITADADTGITLRHRYRSHYDNVVSLATCLHEQAEARVQAYHGKVRKEVPGVASALRRIASGAHDCWTQVY